MIEVLSVCPKQFPGVTSHLEHLARTTGLSEHFHGVTPEKIKDKQMVLFGAWEHTYYLALKKIRKKYSDVKTGLLWTSTIGQMGFSNNLIETSFMWLIRDLLESEMLDYLFVPAKRTFRAFKHFLPEEQLRYFPNTFSVPWILEYKDESIEKEDNWVDLYAPQASRKNLFNQLMACKMADVKLHVNKLDKSLQDFADLIQLDYVDMGWMEAKNFFRSIQSMKLGLQVTYAETFDYVIAEHFALGVPCLFSHTIDWTPHSHLWGYLSILNFDDPYEIAHKIKKLIENENTYNKLCGMVYKKINEVAEKNNKVCIKVLKEIFE
jgi:hypothetical protein